MVNRESLPYNSQLSTTADRDSQLKCELWYDKIPAGKKGVAFTSAQRQRFNGVRISIYKYKEISERDECEVFEMGTSHAKLRKRVQNGVSFSAHDRLKAVNGYR
ncbi:hypothetical protein H2248_004003 [Termitomyces sp. 'cryptogamus']|nr:hypothetical protein H2248_004003 [Termitomyces sp. 'cryptogamus']